MVTAGVTGHKRKAREESKGQRERNHHGISMTGLLAGTPGSCAPGIPRRTPSCALHRTHRPIFPPKRLRTLRVLSRRARSRHATRTSRLHAGAGPTAAGSSSARPRGPSVGRMVLQTLWAPRRRLSIELGSASTHTGLSRPVHGPGAGATRRTPSPRQLARARNAGHRPDRLAAHGAAAPRAGISCWLSPACAALAPTSRSGKRGKPRQAQPHQSCGTPD